MHKNILIYITAFSLCSFLLLAAQGTLQPVVQAVEAEENQESVTTRIQERVEQNAQLKTQKIQELQDQKTLTQEKLQQRKEEIKQTRCEMSQEKIKTQLQKFDDFKSDRDGRATAFDHRLEIVLSKLRAQKMDVTALEKDRETLKTYEAQFSVALGTYADLVEQAHQLSPSCESDGAAFKEALQATRTQMVEVRSAAEQVRTFVKTQLRNDLRAAQKQLSAQNKKSTQ